MKLYTRSGDDGKTGLFSGDRVGKDHPRIEAYGTVDELNACLGLVISGIDGDDAFATDLKIDLLELQSRCFDLGADLATPEGAKNSDKVGRFTDEDVTTLEGLIDKYSAAAPEIRLLVMPGGTETAARSSRCVGPPIMRWAWPTCLGLRRATEIAAIQRRGFRPPRAGAMALEPPAD